MFGKRKEKYFIGIIAVFLLSLMTTGAAHSQDRIRVCDVNIDTANVRESGWFLWKRPHLLDYRVNWRVCDPQGRDVDVSNMGFRLYCWTGDSTFEPDRPSTTPRGMSATLDNKEASTLYYFKVEAFEAGNPNNVIAASETVSEIFPRPREYEGPEDSKGNLIITIIIWIMYCIIPVIFLLGFVVLIRSKRMVKSTKLFPTEFELADKDNALEEICKSACGNKPSNCGLDGDDIKSLLGDKSIMATREGYFGRKLSEICENHRILLGWLKPDRVIRKKTKENMLADIPTTHIVGSGIESCTAVLDRKKIQEAMENRAEVESNRLKRRSFVEWLWYLGFTEPLLGLLGTVFGLTVAFRDFHTRGGGSIEHFAGGIYVALVTTIMGLIAGVILMLAYYYYIYKLDRVDTLWNEMVIRFCEKIQVLANRKSGT